MAILPADQWDAFLERYPDAHLLQTTAWGELKSSFGWDVHRITIDTGAQPAGAQILFRKLPLGFSIAYIPKGPVGHVCSEHWEEIDRLCRQKKSVFLKVEPDSWEDADLEHPVDPGLINGFRLSLQAIQPQRTLIVDLQGTEEDVLDRMKQKTRYNIRLALKKGVVAHPSADLEVFHRLMTTTGERDSFGVHSLKYYRRAYELFHPKGECELLIAEYEGEPLAGLMVFSHGKRAWYLYGASASDHRDRMPTYLLQWEAMRWARSRGCTLYDLWGVPDESENILESSFTNRFTGLWGVYRFKRGFGGLLKRSSGPWDRVYQPILYKFYSFWANRRNIAG